MRYLSTLSILSSSLVCFTNALHFKVQGRHSLPNLLDDTNGLLSRRGNLNGTSPLNNSADISYYTEVILNGQPFSVLIDTGSADLWVAGTVPNAKDTGKSAGVTYAVGEVQGPIKTAEVQLATFKVPNQAFLEVTPDKDNKKGFGLLGLGPHDNSNIFGVLKTDAGVPLLDSIFMQNTSTPNILTVNLGRLEDPSDTFPGDISVGEVLTGLEAINNQPKLPVTVVPVKKKGDQHFQILLDENGIIGPDNQPVSFTSKVSGVSNTKRATAIVDTGFSLTQVPPNVADEFYSRIAGAEYVNVSGIGATWIIPCNQELNLTFVIGGTRYPVHPLDAAINPSVLNMSPIKNSDNDNACIGTFQPISFDVGKDPTYDFILGMSFIRNTYILFNYGDFIGGNDSSKRGDPFLQMLSTTDPAEAHSDFVKARLNGVDTTADQTLGPVRYHTENVNPAKQQTQSNRNKLFLGLAIAAGVLAVLLLVAAFVVARRRGGKKKKFNKASGGGWGGYARINDPDSSHIGMQPYNPYNNGNNASQQQLYGQGGDWDSHPPMYDPPQQAHQDNNTRYSSPWDARH